MNDIKQILQNLRDHKISVDDAYLKLKEKPFEDIGYAKVDLHRKLRQGVSEVIYGAGKTPEQIAGIINVMKSHHEKAILIT
ncbi:MAG: 1-(5-phosphoribosyl)-5-amino-4-imidazole-carboxylate carboxylase, partial [Synergistaceae bacterium]|nr:1-(5-phosphoribosyl)-5-amino-4-imidazole-carboxylate carboxylase [Synergistaceae bacterium]